MSIVQRGAWSLKATSDGRWIAYEQRGKCNAFRLSIASCALLESLWVNDDWGAAHIHFCRRQRSTISKIAFVAEGKRMLVSMASKQPVLRKPLTLHVTVLPAKSVNWLANYLVPLINTKTLWLHLVMLPLAALILVAHDPIFGVTIDTGGSSMILMAGVLASVLFHELGHGAAIKRCGHLPGAVGVGLYVVVPVFFIEIPTYEAIPAGDRAWVNGAGVHCQLLFAHLTLAMALIWPSFGSAPLAALIYYTAVFQLVPVAKSDGYWIITDLLPGRDRLWKWVSGMVSAVFYAYMVLTYMQPLIFPWFERLSAADGLLQAAHVLFRAQSIHPLMALIIMAMGAKAAIMAGAVWIRRRAVNGGCHDRAE